MLSYPPPTQYVHIHTYMCRLMVTTISARRDRPRRNRALKNRNNTFFLNRILRQDNW